MENASFVEEDRLRCRIRSRREIFITVGSFDDVLLNFVPRHLKKSLNGLSAHIPGHIVSRNRAGHSARCLEDVHLRIYFGTRHSSSLCSGVSEACGPVLSLLLSRQSSLLLDESDSLRSVELPVVRSIAVPCHA